MRQLCVALGLTLALAAPASADHGRLNDIRAIAGVRASERHWHQRIPCVHVALGVPPQADRTGAQGWAQAPCRIWIDPDWWATRPHALYVCGLIVHEYGHLLGYQHSTDPRDQMYPTPFPPDACFPFMGRGWRPVSNRTR